MQSKIKSILQNHNVYTDELFKELVKAAGEKYPVPLEERREAFIESLRPYVAEYGKEMIFEFYKYWTEGSKKMRFETQKTFDIKLRLARWKKMSNKFSIVNMLKK